MRRLIFLSSLALLSCGRGTTRADDFTTLRHAMVRDQLEARSIHDTRVLAAMRTVPRHLFVPEPRRLLAYEDFPLPIGEGQTISQPYIVALMTEALMLDGHEKVLEIGTGSGYQAAVLAAVAHEVYTIEIVPSLARRAEQTLERLGCHNVKVKSGDGYLGWSEYAPFDAIIITCAPERVPDSLLRQLAEGGRLVAPIGPEGQTQVLTLFEKTDGAVKRTPLAPVIFVPMQGLIKEE